jgi:hypothetical protein
MQRSTCSNNNHNNNNSKNNVDFNLLHALRSDLMEKQQQQQINQTQN